MYKKIRQAHINTPEKAPSELNVHSPTKGCEDVMTEKCIEEDIDRMSEEDMDESTQYTDQFSIASNIEID